MGVVFFVPSGLDCAARLPGACAPSKAQGRLRAVVFRDVADLALPSAWPVDANSFPTATTMGLSGDRRLLSYQPVGTSTSSFLSAVM